MSYVYIIGPGQILAPNRCQAITRANDNHDYWRQMASLSHIAVAMNYIYSCIHVPK